MEKIKFDDLWDKEEKATAKPVKNSFSSQDLGIRDAMNAMGLDNNKIDWDGKNVLYDGKFFITPDRNENGVTKTNTNSFLKAANDFYKNSGSKDELAGVTAYTSGKLPVSNVVTYGGDGAVMVGGIPVRNTVIIDGKAYAPKSAIDNAVVKYKESTGYKSNTEIAKDTIAPTQHISEKLENKVINSEPYKYDTNSDPVYKAYEKQYKDIAEDAFDDTYAKGAARTGGFANSSAMSAANSAYYKYMDRLDDVIPELARDSYNRYVDEFARDKGLLQMYGTSLDRAELVGDAQGEDAQNIQDTTNNTYNADINTRDYNKNVYEYEEDRKRYEEDQRLKEESLNMDKEYFYNAKLPKEMAGALSALNNLLTENPLVLYDILFDNDQALHNLFRAHGIEVSDKQLNELKKSVGILQEDK